MKVSRRQRTIETLLVEDDAGDVVLIREALDSLDVACHLTVVSDGVEAMEFMRGEGAHSGARRPDLVLLDLNLPRKDGGEVLADIKSDPALMTIPVVVLTTSSAEADVLRSYRLHANAYVTKPANVHKLLEVVRGIDHFFGTVATLPPPNDSCFSPTAMMVRRDVDSELTAEAIPQIAWVASPDGSTVYFNRRGTKYAGAPADATYSWDWVKLVHPDDADRARHGWERRTRTQEPFEMEIRLRRNDGDFRWHVLRAEAVRDSAGHVAKWIGTATDIEDHKRLEAARERAERMSAELAAQLDTLLAGAPIGFGFVDRDLRIVRVNASLAALQGGSAEMLLGHRLSEVGAAVWPNLEPLCRQVLESGVPAVSREATGPSPADPGRTDSWLASYRPVVLDGEIIGVGIVVLDAAERPVSSGSTV